MKYCVDSLYEYRDLFSVRLIKNESNTLDSCFDVLIESGLLFASFLYFFGIFTHELTIPAVVRTARILLQWLRRKSRGDRADRMHPAN